MFAHDAGVLDSTGVERREVVRERDPADRRAVLVRAVRDRYAQLLRLYSGLSRSMNKLLAGYSDTELELIADFMRRTVDAGQKATADLAPD